ncbi:hypothetical protein OESDEN_17555 [Oesophagostomum dentatum]|uniref:Peptidase S1 domain-containing protein n=1 Tax=Oesophagostomum dentatum TaxID=61180 RepID=A0A0B1SHT3_OESDE|nr:hypothetical protein OESDEN_17555 [Oesophagostomum dentatum]
MHKPDAFFIYVGSSCPQKGRCASKRTVYRAVSLTPHKDFNACDISDDIALVELTQDVSSSEAMPICLPRANERLSEPTALGYGFDPDARIKRNPGLQVAKFRQYGMEGPNIFTRDPVTAICAVSERFTFGEHVLYEIF